MGRGKAGALDKGAEATLCVLGAYLRVRIVPLVRLWAVVEEMGLDSIVSEKKLVAVLVCDY